MPTRRPKRAAQPSSANSPAGDAGSAGKPSDGRLYVVATPIGNLGDLSSRAREILASVSLIAAEDTRHSGQMLRGLGISTRLISLHEQNEAARVAEILALLRDGAAVALISDAGTPLISDPGYRLVSAAAAAGCAVSAVPGPCAAIAALSIAGLPSDRFSFEGFPAAKTAARRRQFEQLANETRSMIFYEAPHRLAECLLDMTAAFGAARPAMVARELTKTFETVYRGSLQQLAQAAEQDADMRRGEIVIVIAAAEAPAAAGHDAELDRVLRVLLADLPVAQAARLAAALTGAGRNRAYQRALEFLEKSDSRADDSR